MLQQFMQYRNLVLVILDQIMVRVQVLVLLNLSMVKLALSLVSKHRISLVAIVHRCLRVLDRIKVLKVLVMRYLDQATTHLVVSRVCVLLLRGIFHVLTRCLV